MVHLASFLSREGRSHWQRRTETSFEPAAKRNERFEISRNDLASRISIKDGQCAGWNAQPNAQCGELDSYTYTCLGKKGTRFSLAHRLWTRIESGRSHLQHCREENRCVALLKAFFLIADNVNAGGEGLAAESIQGIKFAWTTYSSWAFRIYKFTVFCSS